MGEGNSGILTEKTISLSGFSKEVFLYLAPPQRNLWNWEQKHCILFRWAAKHLTFAIKSNSKANSNCLHFVLPQAKIFAMYQQKQHVSSAQ
jgi:hypothetical protein